MNTKLATLATEAELKAEQDKIVKLETYDLSFFLDKIFLVIMVLKKCLFVSQHLIGYNYKKARVLIMLLVGNQKSHIVLLFLHNILIFCIA